MTQENNGSVTVTAVMQDPTPSFLSDELNIKRLAKLISNSSKDAVDVLVKLLESEDEKMRYQAATKLIEIDIEVKKIISQDQMQRLIAEIKLVRGITEKKIQVEDDQKKRPLVDFSTIRSVG